MRKVRALSQRRAPSNAVGDDFWQAPSLTASERAYMIRKAKRSVRSTRRSRTYTGWTGTMALYPVNCTVSKCTEVKAVTTVVEIPARNFSVV
ncbi:unnamed protein product [Peronospora farinosa]|uniref:Uncharacterized protein n=1 Tax=Peronospora farinosa TaxID=134698 RepID=A0ABN8CDL3_9STRA|nr:unnamed protein product [Peronospora farinosa]